MTATLTPTRVARLATARTRRLYADTALSAAAGLALDELQPDRRDRDVWHALVRRADLTIVSVRMDRRLGTVELDSVAAAREHAA